MLCHYHYFFIFADSSPSHPSVSTHSLPTTMSEDNDEFSDFQGPVETPSSFSCFSSSTSGFTPQAQALNSKTGFSDDDDGFSDFVQGPVNSFTSSNLHLSSQVPPSSPSLRTSLSSSPLHQSQLTSVSIQSAVTTSSQSTFQGNFPFSPSLPSQSTMHTPNVAGSLLLGHCIFNC